MLIRVLGSPPARLFYAAFRSRNRNEANFCMSDEMASFCFRLLDIQATACHGDRIVWSPSFSQRWRSGSSPKRFASEAQPKYWIRSGMQQGGTQYRRLIAAFQRIFGATNFSGLTASAIKRQ